MIAYSTFGRSRKLPAKLVIIIPSRKDSWGVWFLILFDVQSFTLSVFRVFILIYCFSFFSHMYVMCPVIPCALHSLTERPNACLYSSIYLHVPSVCVCVCVCVCVYWVDGGAELDENTELGQHILKRFPLHMYARLERIRHTWVTFWKMEKVRKYVHVKLLYCTSRVILIMSIYYTLCNYTTCALLPFLSDLSHSLTFTHILYVYQFFYRYISLSFSYSHTNTHTHTPIPFLSQTHLFYLSHCNTARMCGNAMVSFKHPFLRNIFKARSLHRIRYAEHSKSASRQVRLHVGVCVCLCMSMLVWVCACVNVCVRVHLYAIKCSCYNSNWSHDWHKKNSELILSKLSVFPTLFLSLLHLIPPFFLLPPFHLIYLTLSSSFPT